MDNPWNRAELIHSTIMDSMKTKADRAGAGEIECRERSADGEHDRGLGVERLMRNRRQAFASVEAPLVPLAPRARQVGKTIPRLDLRERHDERGPVLGGLPGGGEAQSGYRRGGVAARAGRD